MPTKFEVTKAVRASDLPAPARLVMFVLADVAETGTAEIPEQFTPSLSVLGRETGLNESTVKRHLRALEAEGWVERRRPTVEAARLRGERTRYRLAIPGCTESPAHGAEGPQEGAQEAQGRAQKEPRAGRTQRPSKEEVNQVNQGQSEASPPEPFDEHQDTAQTIVGGWIDYCASRDVKLPRRLIGQYAKLIKEALTEQFPPTLVKKTLAGMLDDNVANRPSLLPNRLVAAQTGPEVYTNGHKPGSDLAMTNGAKPSTAVQRASAGLEIANRLRQQREDAERDTR